MQCLTLTSVNDYQAQQDERKEKTNHNYYYTKNHIFSRKYLLLLEELESHLPPALDLQVFN